MWEEVTGTGARRPSVYSNTSWTTPLYSVPVQQPNQPQTSTATDMRLWKRTLTDVNPMSTRSWMSALYSDAYEGFCMGFTNLDISSSFFSPETQLPLKWHTNRTLDSIQLTTGVVERPKSSCLFENRSVFSELKPQVTCLSSGHAMHGIKMEEERFAYLISHDSILRVVGFWRCE